MPANIGFFGPTRGGAQKRVPGVAPVSAQTSQPITRQEAAALAQFWGEDDFGTGFDTAQFAPGFAPALSVEPDIIYRGVQSPVSGAGGLPVTGPITPEEAAAIARFMDDGEGGFDAPDMARSAVPSGPPEAPRTTPVRSATPGKHYSPVPEGAFDGPPADMPWYEDVGRSALTGLAELPIGLVGMPGDASRHVVRTVVESKNPLVRYGGLMSLGAALPFLSAPTSDDVREGVEEWTGPLHQPQSPAGEYARTAGSFAGALLGGPRSWLMKAANVGVPTILSETAGQAARRWAPEWEGVSRVAGALGWPLGLYGAGKKLESIPHADRRRVAQETFDAEDVGGVTAGQATGSRSLRQFESDFGGKPAKDAAERQRRDFTRATLRRAGIDDADEASANVIKRAERDLDAKEHRAWQAGDHAAREEARRQKRNLATIKKAVPENGGSGARPRRDVLPDQLREADAENYARGEGDFYGLTRAGETLMSPVPSTGSASRLAMSAIPGVAGTVAGGPAAGAVGAGFGFAAPHIAGRTIMSRPVQSFIRHDLIPQTRARSIVPRAGYYGTVSAQTPVPSNDGGRVRDGRLSRDR